MRRKTVHLVFLSLILSVGISSYSQVKKEKLAAQSFDRLAYSNAIDIYETLATKGYVNTSILQNLADAYYFNGQLPEANQWYSELFEGDYKDKAVQKLSSEYYYRYSQTLKSVDDYKKSQEFMDRFVSLEQGDSRGDLYRKNRDYLSHIENHSDQYEIRSLPLNSVYSDYGGRMLGLDLVFTSARATQSESGDQLHGWTHESYTSLYLSRLQGGSFGEPERLALTVDTSVNDASAVFSKDGKTMYFTRNNSKSNGKSKQNKTHSSLLKIYKSIKQVDGQWGQVEELPINSDDFNTAHPALTPDENWLYFSSDRQGSVGQSDLYRVALYENGGYGSVENLGKGINTEGRESFAFISADQQLYFSSDGHPGLGGLDVFVSKIYPDGSFGPVVNIGKPINSNRDDFGFYIDSQENKGFVSSNREGGKGSDDIYFFAEKPCRQTLEGKVYDKRTNDVLTNAVVIISDALYQQSDTVRTNSQGYYSSTALACGYKYRIKAQRASYNTVEVVFNIDHQPGVKTVNIGLEETEIALEVNDDLFKTLKLAPIYFDFDKSDIRYDASIELMKIVEVMKKHPSLKIDVRSHTDSKGKDAYNLSLSDRRAKSTIQWMIGQGITPSRLTGRGYGETQLLNPCSNGVRCSEEQHQENRRSAFIILEK
ncbi:OmpA family protein [Myroides odoratus]|uniref:OmpA family protein n=1 Tax=Myroides odoratus TaxID=256 RepID=UPI0039B0022B